MIAEIRCTVCMEFIGSIDKSEVTDEDRRLYAESVMCSNGHGGHVGSPDIQLDEEEVTE